MESKSLKDSFAEIKNFAGLKSLFFENKTLKQTIFKNTFWLTVGLAVDRLLRFILLVYAARILGATEYGKFTFVFSFISLFIIFCDFGLSDIIIREFSREEKKEELSALFSLKILLSVGTFFLILLISFLTVPDHEVRKIILILAPFTLINGLIGFFYAFFQAIQKMEYRTWSEVFLAILLTGIGLFLIFNFPSAINLSYSYLISGVIVLFFILIFFRIKIFKLKILWQISVWKKFLRMSWPLALAGLFGALYNYIDSVMLGFWGMMTQAGWYNAAYKVISVAIVPGALISRSFFPVLSKLFKESKETFQAAWEKQMELMIFLAVPIAIGGVVFATKIIGFVYGNGYLPSILAFQILVLSAGITFLNRPFDDVIILSNQQKKIFLITIFGAVINVVFNFILIPKYSLYGAAAATVITNILVFFMYILYTRKYTPIKLLRRGFLRTFMLSVFSSGLMYFVVQRPIIYNLNIIFSLAVGAITYFAAFFGLKFILEKLKKINYGFNK